MNNISRISEALPARLRPQSLVPTVDVTQTLRTLWRRRYFLLAAMVLALLVGWVAVSRMTPIYTASVKVMVDERSSRFVDLQQAMTSRVPAYMAVASEVEIIMSRGLAQRVADSLNLYEDPEFNPTLRQAGQSAGFVGGTMAMLRETWNTVFGRTDAETSETEAERRDRGRRAVVDGVLGRLGVSPVAQSVVIVISFNSTDPAKAARIANVVAEHYVTAQLEAKFEAIRHTTTWLTNRLESLREAVSRSEGAVADYRKLQGLVESGGRLPSQQFLTELNSQLLAAQGRRAEQQARVGRIEGLLRDGRGLEAVGEVLDSPLVQRLKEQEATLAREISDLTQRYGERHPQMAKVRAEQAQMRAKIDAEVNKLASGLRNELGVLRDREGALRAQVSMLEKTILEQNDAQIRLRELERDAQANRSLYEAFLTRFKETGKQEEIQRSDARIISAAEQPRGPSYPRPRLIYAAAAMLGLIAGAVFVLIAEQLNRTIRSREQLEEITGLPVLGQIPHVRALPGRQVHTYVVNKPSSSFAEAFRIAWFALKHSDPTSEPRVILVTSAVPEEGKSLTSLSLARTAANLGLRVCLVDADLRRPSLSGTLGIAPTRCIREVLAGNASIDEAITKDPHSSVDMLLSAKPMTGEGFDLPGSKAMIDLTAQLRERYDLVVFDSPPTLPVADAQLLGQLVDRTIFCVRWDKTPHGSVTLALRTLQDAHIRVSGLLLTRVVARKHARYGGDMGYYYGKYRGYYTG